MATKSLFKKNATSKKQFKAKLTNSGKVVLDILGVEEKNPNLSDFSNFPSKSEKIEGLNLEQIASCGFNNVVSAYYSRTNLNEWFGKSDISLLRGGCITYAIVLDNGKWYFGSTTDFGERIHTWLKDFRGNEMSKERERKSDRTVNEQLSSDARKFKRVLFIPLAFSKTKNDAKIIENKLIVDFVNNRFSQITGGEPIDSYSFGLRVKYTQKYIYNKVRAIGD